MSYYRRKEYTYSGGDKTFTITFPYIIKEHIEVYVNDTKITNFTFNTSTQIVINDSLVNGDKILLKSNTPIDKKLVNFTDTSILKKDAQNLAQDQMFYAVQENADNNEKFTIIAETLTNDIATVNTKTLEAIAAAEDATDQANIAATKADEAAASALSMSDATEIIKGRMRFSTSSEGLVGTDDDSAMTPLKTKNCINNIVNTNIDKDIIDLGTATTGTKTCNYMDTTYKLIANGAFTLALPTESGATKARIVRIKLTMSSINSVTFPASVKWANNVAPSLTSTTATYILTFITEDGGTSWEGSCSTFGA